jgi:glycosyltransferase involved in cell wall biosynthesis
MDETLRFAQGDRVTFAVLPLFASYRRQFQRRIGSPNHMHIAMVGTRGVPAAYSGFETCVEQVGSRLVTRGHQVTVYCRSHHIRYAHPTYRGMRLIRLPTIQNKYLDTIAHTFLSLLHALFQPYDAVLMFIVGNSSLAWIPRLRGQKVVLNVDGLDWKRKKWPLLAKAYIRWTERLATLFPHAFVTDSSVVQRYYREKYNADSTYIPYGAEVQRRPPGKWLARFGLEPQQYILFVGRLVPENCLHHLLEAFDGLETDMRCTIIGDAPYAEGYIRTLKGTKDPRVIFTGYLFGKGYEELVSNAYVFVETSGVGGTHPALIEAMALGNCVVVNDTPENLEVIGNAGLSYDGQIGGPALQEILAQLIAESETVEMYQARAAAHVGEHYDWEQVTDRYEHLFQRLVAGQGEPR